MRDWAMAANRPLTRSLSRIAQRWAIRGRGENGVGTLTQGGARGSGPSLALGYFVMPFQGSQEEAVASCRRTSRKTVSSGRH
jgi:hypothetical protein